MSITTNGTRLRCGEHGAPLFYTPEDGVTCDEGCDKSWSDLLPETGEQIVTRGVTGTEVWMVTTDPYDAVFAPHTDDESLPCWTCINAMSDEAQA